MYHIPDTVNGSCETDPHTREEVYFFNYILLDVWKSLPQTLCTYVK